MVMSKVPVYFMPGLAASPAIFENIKLPEDQFEMYFLEWFLPNDKECIRVFCFQIPLFRNHQYLHLLIQFL